MSCPKVLILQDGPTVALVAESPVVLVSPDTPTAALISDGPTALLEQTTVLTAVLNEGTPGQDGEDGEAGADGASAYEIAVAEGFVGDVTAWLASLVGPAGADGDDGADGASAYEVAVAGGFVGDESAWLASLVGADGADGTDGEDGAPGPNEVTSVTATDLTGLLIGDGAMVGTATITGGLQLVGGTLSIADAAVTYAKIQPTTTTDVLLGRSSAGGGTVQEIACTSFARTILDDVDAAAVRTTLGLVIGTNVMAQDAELAAIAGLTSAADKGIQFTGSGTAGLFDLTAFAKTILDDTSAPAVLATLGVVNGLALQSAQTASFTAVAGNAYPVDLSGASGHIAVTFPAGAAAGDRFAVFVKTPHASHTYCARPVTGGSAPSVRGTTAHDNKWSLWAIGERLDFLYDGVTWQVANDGRIPHCCCLRQTSAQNINHDTTTKVTFDETLYSTVIGDLANSRAAIRRGGKYVPTGYVSFSSIADGTRVQALLATGSSPAVNGVFGAEFVGFTGTATVVQGGTYRPIVLANGEFVELHAAWLVSGGSSTKGTNVAADTTKPFLSIVEILD